MAPALATPVEPEPSEDEIGGDPTVIDDEPLAAPQEPLLGEIVHFVMADSVTIRPAMVVAYFSVSPVTGKPNVDLRVNLQVFVDGQFDDATVRGPHANATLQDWKVDSPYDPGETDPKTGELVFKANTWHRHE